MLKKIIVTIVFILIIVMGFIYMKKWIPVIIKNEIERSTCTILEDNKRLSTEIKNLKDEIENLKKQSNNNYSITKNFDSEKWNAWCNLKDCLMKNKNYSAELEKFKKLFSSNIEIIKIIDSLIEKSNKYIIISKSFTKYLQKFVNIYNISSIDLFKIDGYILAASIN